MSQDHLPPCEKKNKVRLVITRDNFCKFCIKIVVIPHLNLLNETIQMGGGGGGGVTTYGFDEK